MVFNVLANDGIGDEGVEVFRDAGINVSLEKLLGKDLFNGVGEFDGLLVRSATKVSRDVIEAGTRDGGKLKIVGRAGVGYDNVDVDSAAQNGVVVKFAPHGNTNATAEAAFGLMISAARNIPQAHSSLSNGVWRKKQYSGIELSNKTLGIIGCGRIGQRLSELVSGFGMSVIGYDAFSSQCSSKFPDSRIKYVKKEELLGNSDFVSIHTGGKDVVIGKGELSMMKPSSILVNASRGKNIDEGALYNALVNDQIRAAGLDSYASEPKVEGSDVTESMKKLATLDNIVLSSHLGASTKEAQSKTSREVAEVVRDFLLLGDYCNSVNTVRPRDEGEKCYPLFVLHDDVPNMFGKISAMLAHFDVNIRANPSEVFGDTGKVNTVYLLHQSVTPKIIKGVRAIDGVYRVSV